MYDLCHRWSEHPPPEEVEAAKLRYRKRVVDRRDWIDAPRGKGRTTAERGLAVMGGAIAAVAAAANSLYRGVTKCIARLTTDLENDFGT
ncbi:hypothetical protein Daesc_009272 [Daldinia eschscholtzii]|uniref:Uncharacterized protein n=1 Tax=Daldinia eschscholtzii TaxID=292717 RepID=A0AAX6M940_9PEZI